MIGSSTAAFGLSQIALVWDVLELTSFFILPLLFIPLCYDVMLVWIFGVVCNKFGTSHYSYVYPLVLFTVVHFSSSACMLHLI